jgi:hypothetical protein
MMTNFLIANAAIAERVDRIKEAKSEAEALIAAYRAEMEANYQKKMNMVRKNILLFWLSSENLGWGNQWISMSDNEREIGKEGEGKEENEHGDEDHPASAIS